MATESRRARNKRLMDPLYRKFTSGVIRSIGSTEFYEFFMDTMSRADNTIQFSNRRMEKIVDLSWVEAIEDAIEAMQNIVANPRNIIREEELIVNVAHAKKGGSDVVRHLAQHGQLVEDFNEATGEVRPSKLMQKYRDDSEDLYENRLAFTTIEMAHHFVKIRYDALFAAMGEEYGAKLKVESRLETAVEELQYESFLHIKQKDSALDIDEKNGNVFNRIERLNRLLLSFLQSPYGIAMSKTSRVKGKITKTNILKKNPNYRKLVNLYEFLKNYEDVGYTIKITEQNPNVDEVFVQNVFHNLLFQYITLKGYLDKEEERELPTPLKQRKRKLKPKVIKEIVEELTDNYDIPDLEIRKVLIEELTKEQLMLEEAEERRRLVEEQEARKKADEEYRKRLEEEAEKKRIAEEEAEAERIRLEQEEQKRLERVRLLEQQMEDARRRAIFEAELDHFKRQLYDRLDARSQILEALKETEVVVDPIDAAKVIEDAEIAEREAIEAEERRKEEEERVRLEQIAKEEAARLLEEEKERERIRIQLETEAIENDMAFVAPYLNEVRDFQVNLSVRRNMRVEQIRLEKEEQQKLLEERMARLAKRDDMNAKRRMKA